MSVPDPRLVDGWRLAVGTFTAIPVTPPSRIDREVAGIAMLLAPVAVAPLAALWAVGAVTAAVGAHPAVVSIVVVVGIVLSTRAMHLDGLADTADGLSASYDRDRALAVMKTGDVGPSGAAAIALVLLMQTSGTGILYSAARESLLPVLVTGIVAVCGSRVGAAVACRRGVPAARPGGLGATVAESVSPVALGGVVAASGLVWSAVSVMAGGSWWPPVVAMAVPLVVTGILVRRAVTRLGGITGDVIGAAVEMSLASTLVAVASFPL